MSYFQRITKYLHSLVTAFNTIAVLHYFRVVIAFQYVRIYVCNIYL